MDYGKLLTRSWDIIWNHKYLILLGVLVALGNEENGASFSGSPGSDTTSSNGGFQFQMPGLEVGQGIEPFLRIAEGINIVPIGLVLIIGLLVWTVSRIATGGLIDGVNAIDGGGLSSFGQAWQAGWAKGWRLFGIGLIRLIPVLILLVVSIGAGVLLDTSPGVVLNESDVVPPATGLAGAPVIATACLAIPVVLVLSLLQTFADRACMLEDLAVWAAYGRGGRVLLANLGPALVLFLIEIAISIGLAIGLLMPSTIMALCCLLWPLLLLVQGAISAYFSTIWTLAWRQWTVAEV